MISRQRRKKVQVLRCTAEAEFDRVKTRYEVLIFCTCRGD